MRTKHDKGKRVSLQRSAEKLAADASVRRRRNQNERERPTEGTQPPPGSPLGSGDPLPAESPRCLDFHLFTQSFCLSLVRSFP